MKRSFALLAACAALAVGLTGCGDNKQEKAAAKAPAAKMVTLKVGASPIPHGDVLKFVVPELKKEGVDLKVIEFTDYVKPNLALADKELDANYFQHVPYLESFAKDRKLQLSVLCSVHIEPMGIYSKTVKDLAAVKVGAKVAIPNDPTNGGRALKVLADAGLFSLKAGVGINGTPADVINNKFNLKFVEMEAAVLPRSLDDVTLAVINSNYALGVGMNPAKDALFVESKDSPYANVVVVRTGDNREALSKLAKALRTPAVRQYIEKQFKGAVYPTF